MKRIIQSFITISLAFLIMIGIIIPAFNLGEERSFEIMIAFIVTITVVRIIFEKMLELNKHSKDKANLNKKRDKKI